MLLSRIRQDRDEFERVALPYVAELYRTPRAALGGGQEAEHVVQDTYLEAWKSFHRFERGTNSRAWLHKILVHRMHHHRRKWGAWRSRLETEGQLENTAVRQPPVADDIRDEDMLAALERLPEPFRTVLLLADVQEFSYQEIAGMLQVPIGTVMSRLSRARGS